MLNNQIIIMKKLYFLFTFLLVSVSYSQELMVNGDFEAWDDSTTPTGYWKAESTTQESVDVHGGSFSAKQVAGSTQDIAQDISGVTPGENYTITLWYKVESGDGTDARIWSYWLNGASTVTDANTDADLRGPNNSYFDNNGNVWSQYSVTVTAPAGVDGFRFEVRAYSGSTVYWDDFSFFQEAPSLDPTLTVVGAPSSGSTVELGPEDLTGDFEFATTNFTVAVPSNGDGYISWSMYNETDMIVHDSGDVFDTSMTYPISLDPNKTYNFTAELLDNSGASLNPAVVYTLTIITFGYNTVSNLAAVRAGVDGEYYEVTGEVLVSFITGNSRNQIFIQDASAGILIDDPDGIISTSYNNNDGITGYKGQLGAYAGVLQFVPTVDPGVASSTGNTITPQVITVNDLLTSIDTYESELVQINDVTFADGDGITTFASSSNYDISDQSGGPLAFRTNYPNDNMAGELIPNTATNIVVLAGEFFGTPQVYPRQPDEVLSLSNFNSRVEFNLFPNPTSTGIVNIVSTNSTSMQVKVFDILGKQVKNETINSTLNVSGLKSGIYILNITQEGYTVTKKLVID